MFESTARHMGLDNEIILGWGTISNKTLEGHVVIRLPICLFPSCRYIHVLFFTVEHHRYSINAGWKLIIVRRLPEKFCMTQALGSFLTRSPASETECSHTHPQGAGWDLGGGLAAPGSSDASDLRMNRGGTAS